MTLRVAFMIGKGTGKELADVFERVILKLSSHYSVPVELHASSRVYHSNSSLLEDYNHPEEIDKEALQDALHYEEFCWEQAARGTRVIFATAVNSQSLYLVRQDFQAVKVACFGQAPNSLLVVEDQSQKFCNGPTDCDLFQGIVSRSRQFSKELANRIITYSVDRARQLWGNEAISSVSMVYKLDSFDGVFRAWAKEWSSEHGIKIEIAHPDTASKTLFKNGIRGRQLMIVGHECADIMQAILLHISGLSARESRCTETVYLHPDVGELSEYQTANDSSDDVSGKGTVNPAATVRAAASILERRAGCKGIEAAMEVALSSLRQRNMLTRDQGGNKTTTEVVDCILDTLTAAPLASTSQKLSQTSSGRKGFLATVLAERADGFSDEKRLKK